MSENLANNAVTQLQANVLTSDTQISVLSSAEFPEASYRIKIDDELMLVTAVDGDVWTVTRGVESTTTAQHSINASVASVLTVGGLTGFVVSQISDSGFSPVPMIPTTDGAYRMVVSGGVPQWIGSAYG